ncbi:hypothetical protein ROS62_14350 [Streptomyces sp. DSM 41972]|uniref:Uncharacterized protein n=1 Tax=Streptomyces althioticus subsp. attaecolombicae TaxID=3075534 RepID=A0ABU3HZ85_9ACTN|nr:hypothetical protein [Streptomyces sp. DSM 41972]
MGVSAASGRAVPVSVEGPAGDTARLEALLVTALVRDGVNAGAEQRAVAAFVAARESGAHGARTRRRDDWRASRRRFGGRSLRATLGALVAGCALSGVAWAGIQAAGVPGSGRSEDTGPSRAPSASSAPVVPDASGGSGASGAGGIPEESASASAAETGRDGAWRGSGAAESAGAAGAAGGVGAQCRAYERVAGQGRAADAPAWERLVAAAGGAGKAEAYCAGRGGGGRPTTSVSAPVGVPPETGAAAGAGRPTGEAAGTDPSDLVKGKGRRP